MSLIDHHVVPVTHYEQFTKPHYPKWVRVARCIQWVARMSYSECGTPYNYTGLPLRLSELNLGKPPVNYGSPKIIKLKKFKVVQSRSFSQN